MTKRRLASVSIALVGLAVAVLIVARDETATEALTALAITTFLVILAVQIGNVVTDSIRYWMVLPGRFRVGLPMWRWHHIFAVGRLLNLLLPQAGAAYRAARLRMGHGVPIATFFGSVAAITWLGNGIALLAAALAVTLAGEVVAGMVIAAIGAAILIGIWALPRLPWFAGEGAPRWIPERLVGIIANFGEAFRELGAGRSRLVPVLGMSVLSQMAGLTAYVIAVAALGADDPIVAGAVIYSGTTIATVVSLSPGGLGITELTAGLAGAAVEFGAASAVLAAFIIRATGLVAVGGLALLAGGFTPEGSAPPTGDG